jgi:hypothetical protein
MRWIIDHLFWDTTDTARRGFWGSLRGAWKLLVALAGSALLTWGEWVLHHPPEIAVVALIHFVFVLVAIALVVHIVRWFSRNDKESRGG